MKKIVLILTWLAVTAINCLAQEGEIIYIDYEPDSLVELKQYVLYPECKMMIDFDYDSLPDIRITRYIYSGGGWYDMIPFDGS